MWGRLVLLALALAGGWAGLLGGCAAKGGARPLELMESQVFAIPGRTLVAPLRLSAEGDRSPQAPPAPPARLDDGRRVPAQLVWVSVRPSPGPAPAWLADPGVWSAAPAGAAGAGDGVGFWALVLELPPDAAGQSLWLGGGGGEAGTGEQWVGSGRRRVELDWLETPGEADVAPPWPELAPGGRRRAQLVWFEPEGRSPLTRWRFTLISAGLGGAGRPAPGDRFEDGPVEALAQQYEDRWAIALARLARHDAGLADRFARRLTAAVDFGEALAPAFEPEDAGLSALLVDLLSADVEDDIRSRRVEGWLLARAGARAWVIDDVGAGASDEAALAVVGLANLGSRPALGWALAAGASRGSAEPVEVAPFAVEAVVSPVPSRGADGRPLRELEVALGGARLGESRITLHAQDEPLHARPPGLRLGPMLSDWTLATWRSGSAAAVAPGMPGATGALLRQSRRDDGDAVWTVYIEARQAARDGGVREQARLWFGPRGDPLAVVQIDPARTASESGQAGAVRLAQSDDRWVAEVEIDPAWIEPEGRLRIGFERIDAAGRRSAWPRPMLPWQTEPGRALVDLNAWGSLRGEAPDG